MKEAISIPKETLLKIANTIMEANKEGIITDTIFYDRDTTLVEFILENLLSFNKDEVENYFTKYQEI